MRLWYLVVAWFILVPTSSWILGKQGLEYVWLPIAFAVGLGMVSLFTKKEVVSSPLRLLFLLCAGGFAVLSVYIYGMNPHKDLFRILTLPIGMFIFFIFMASLREVTPRITLVLFALTTVIMGLFRSDLFWLIAIPILGGWTIWCGQGKEWDDQLSHS